MKGQNGGLPASQEVLDRARKLKVILMDVDGVLTDGKLYYLPGHDGAMVETKGFNTQDGLGLYLCADAGISTGVISGRNSPATVERCRMLNMKYVYQGHLEKVAAFQEVLEDAGVTADQVAFIGDDLTDVPLFRRCGLGVAVANARDEVKAAAHYVTETAGGEGAVREFIEIVLKSQGLWEQAVAKYMAAPVVI